MLEYLISLDKRLFELINSHWTAGWADFIFPLITDLHKNNYFKTLFLPLFLLFLLWKKGLTRGFLIFVFSFLCLGLSDGVGNWLFKKNFQRLRPPDTQGLVVTVRAPYGGYSFVSNHATNTFALATFISLVLPQAAGLLLSIALLVSYSRVYCGVHFPLDVICGALLGVFVGHLMWWFYRFLSKKLKLQEVRK